MATQTLRKIRENPLAAYLLPFVLFMVMTALEPTLREQFGVGYPLAYAIKIAIVAAATAQFWPKYPKFQAAGFPLAIAFGVGGVVLWIWLAGLGLERHAAAYLPEALAPKRVAFNPFEAIGSPVERWAFLALRFFGLALVVPVIEEVFWRGFLLRYLIAENFESVPFGKYAPTSFVVTTIAFAAVHPEFVAALVWGAGINWLAGRTKNLWACVLAHATTNFLLGVYVVVRGAWELW